MSAQRSTPLRSVEDPSTFATAAQEVDPVVVHLPASWHQEHPSRVAQLTHEVEVEHWSVRHLDSGSPAAIHWLSAQAVAVALVAWMHPALLAVLQNPHPAGACMTQLPHEVQLEHSCASDRGRLAHANRATAHTSVRRHVERMVGCEWAEGQRGRQRQTREAEADGGETRGSER